MIKLKDFVAGALSEIIEGVQVAQEHAAKVGARINPNDTNVLLKEGERVLEWAVGGFTHKKRYGQYIDFDVAITTTDKDTGRAGIGLFVAGIGIGTQAESEGQSGTISRISFSVPVFLPEQTNE